MNIICGVMVCVVSLLWIELRLLVNLCDCIFIIIVSWVICDLVVSLKFIMWVISWGGRLLVIY